MATLVNYTCKRLIKLKPGLVSRCPPRLSRNLSNPDFVTGPKQIVVSLRNRTGEQRGQQTLCDKCDNNFV